MSLLLSRGIPRVALFLGLRRFPGTIRYREAGPTVVLTGRRRYAKTRRREGNTDQRRATEQPQGNNNNNNKKNNGRQFIQHSVHNGSGVSAQPRVISVTSVSSVVRIDPLDSWTGACRAGGRFYAPRSHLRLSVKS